MRLAGHTEIGFSKNKTVNVGAGASENLTGPLQPVSKLSRGSRAGNGRKAPRALRELALRARPTSVWVWSSIQPQPIRELVR